MNTYKINKNKKFYGVPLTFSPAAVDTLLTHFNDTNRTPDYYDLIVTGDLGQLGYDIVCDLMGKHGYDMKTYNDCGLIIYDNKLQDTHSGGSGCGCSAVVLCSYILELMTAGKLNDVLFIGTGALMSPTSTQQGESIPSIAHAVTITNKGVCDT